MSAMNDDNDDDADDDNVAMMMMKVSVLPIAPNYTKTIRCNPKHSNEMQCTACMHHSAVQCMHHSAVQPKSIP